MGILGSNRYQFIFSGLEDKSIVKELANALVCPLDGSMDACFGVDISLVGDQCGQLMVSSESFLLNDNCTQPFGNNTH